MATPCDEIETKNLIRKYRKKLRQIEHLERLNRELSSDEVIKIESKHEIRELLQETLLNYNEENNVTEAEENEEVTTDHFKLEEDLLKEKAPFQENEDFYQKETELQSPTIEARGTDELQEKVKSGPDKRSDVKAQNAASGDCATTKEKEKKKKSSKPSLSNSFKVTCLEGHNDLITAVVLHKDTIITASQDTTVKIWSIITGEPLKNFGAHTMCVTCLVVLDACHAKEAVPDSLESDESVVVSGSYDCTLKVWSLDTGELLKSIYTYNPISKISYSSEFALIILGTDGGKVELWDLNKSEQRYSFIAFDGSVTGIKIDDTERQLYTSASDGTIKVFSISEDARLSCVFESESVKCTSGKLLIPRHVRSLELCKHGSLIGDDSMNIKILNWKKNEVSKVPNHHSEFSSVDSIRCCGGFVISSSYDLDSGHGYLNVRSSHTLDYLASLNDEDTQRILCIDFGHLPNGNMVLVTGGVELKIWELLKQNARDRSNDLFHTQYRRALAGIAIDSEEEDDEDDEDYTQESSSSGLRSKSLGFEQEAAGSWTSWCSLL